MSLLQGSATKIAVVQLKVIQDEKGFNLENGKELLLQAITQGAKIICLPQTFATGTNFPSIRRNAEEERDSEILKTIMEISEQNSVYIIFGMLEKEGTKYYDSAYVIDKKGKIAGKYRRNSLLREESEYISRGQEGEIIDTEYGKIGLILGYDIRFPVSCLNYFKGRVQLIVSMSNMFVEYGYPVETICRARAADNICYFVNCSCVGMHKFVNTNYMGNSLIIDGTIENLKEPHDQDVLARADQKEMILYADLYFKKLERYQKKPSTRYYEDYQNFWIY